MSFAADRRSMVFLALCASLLLHALAVALAPHTQKAVGAVAPPVEVIVWGTIRPAPPPPPLPAPAVRAPRAVRAAKPLAPAPAAAVPDHQGELAAPVGDPPFKFMLAPFTAAPPAPKTGEAPRGPPVETAATLESEVRPTYPEEARLEDIQGVVVLRVSISEDGRVLDAKTESDPGGGLGDAARAAVMKARFTPATRDGVRVKTSLIWRYEFVLR
jgi:protein TonB